MNLDLQAMLSRAQHYRPEPAQLASPALPAPAAPALPLEAAPMPSGNDTVVQVDFSKVRLNVSPAASPAVCEPASAPPVASTRSSRLVWASDLRGRVPRPGLVDGVLPPEGLAMIYGASNSGKTACATDLACRVACGIPWQGREVQQGTVLYVAAEAPGSVEDRIIAWGRHHGREVPNLALIGEAVDLGSGEAVTQLLADAQEAASLCGPVRLVVFDTLAFSMPGLDENASRDAGMVMAALGRIRQETGALVLVVHHTGKDKSKGARGSSVLRASMDVELLCDDGALKITKSRDGINGLTFGFGLAGVEYAASEVRSYTAVVATEMAADETRGDEKSPRRLTDKQRLTLDAITAALNDHGQDAPPAHDIPRKAKVVGREHALDAFRRYVSGIEPRRVTQEFQRLTQSLQAQHLLKHAGGMYWLPSRTRDEV